MRDCINTDINLIRVRYVGSNSQSSVILTSYNLSRSMTSESGTVACGKWAVRHPKIVPGTAPTISKPANHSTPSKCQCGVVPGTSRYMYMRSGTVLPYLL